MTNPDQQIGILRETIVALVRSDGPDLDAGVDATLRACVAGKLPGHAIDDPAFLQPARGMNAIGG